MLVDTDGLLVDYQLLDFSNGLSIQWSYFNGDIENTPILWTFPISINTLLYGSYQLGKNNNTKMLDWYNQTTYLDTFTGTTISSFLKNNYSILQRGYGFLLAIGFLVITL